MAVLCALAIVIPGEAKRRPGTQLAVPVFVGLGPGYSATRNSGMTSDNARIPQTPVRAGEGDRFLVLLGDLAQKWKPVGPLWGDFMPLGLTENW